MYRFVSWLLGTSLFATACALALTLGTEKLLLGHLLPALSPLHLLVAGCTLAEYNIHYLLHARGLLSNAAPGQSVYPRFWHPLLCLVGGVMCLLALPSLPRDLIFSLLGFSALALLYSAPSLPFRPKRGINDYGITKISVLTLTWVVVTTVFPALFLKLPWNAAGIEIVWRTLLILPLCLAFDLRDVVVDKKYGVQTIAGTLGEVSSYRIAYGTLALLVAAGGVFYLILSPDASRAFAIIFSALAAIITIAFSRKRPHPFVYSGLIDGVMLLYGALMIFVK